MGVSVDPVMSLTGLKSQLRTKIMKWGSVMYTLLLLFYLGADRADITVYTLWKLSAAKNHPLPAFSNVSGLYSGVMCRLNRLRFSYEPVPTDSLSALV